MATFLTLQQELAAQAGLTQTTSSYATLLKRWINNAQQIILRSFEWPFLNNPTPLVIQTVADYTTGTIATTAGSTTVTFSSAPTTSKTGFYLQTSSSSDWYRITAHTASSATATLEIAAINTAAAATFTVRKFYYSTSTAVDRIIYITQDTLPYQLTETSQDYFQSVNPGFLSSGTPRLYCMSGLDAAGTPQFRLWPNPDAVINLSIYYIQAAVDMVADADVSIIPAKWHTTVLLEGAKMSAFQFGDDSKYQETYAVFYKMLGDMKTEYEIGLHRHRVMTSIDNQSVGGSLGYMPFPFNYPRGS